MEPEKTKKTKAERRGENKKMVKHIIFKKREKPVNQRYLEGQELLDMRDYINDYIYFYRDFEPAFEVNKGEIYYADFPVGFGSEIHGRHPVVVIHRSGPTNSMMTVVPLTSKTANRVSDYKMGCIKGLAKKDENSVAVINQLRSIDKRRIVIQAAIEKLKDKELNNPLKAGEKTHVETLSICRLPEKDFDKLFKKIKRYVFNGTLKSAKQL